MRTLRVQNISFIYRIPRRNLRINPAVIFCILLSAVLILLPASGSRISGTDAAGAGGMQGAVAVVEGNEPLRVRILTGSFAGSEAEAGIPETAEAAFPQGAKTGERILVSMSIEDGRITGVSLSDTFRLDRQLTLGIICMAGIILLTGRKKITSIIMLIPSMLLVWKIILPAWERGFDPTVSGILAALGISAVLLLLQARSKEEFAAAYTGCAGSILMTAAVAAAAVPDLLTGDGGILLAGMLSGASGAAADTGLRIVRTMKRSLEWQKDMNWLEAAHTGMASGRLNMGMAAVVLLSAYLCGCVGILASFTGTGRDTVLIMAAGQMMDVLLLGFFPLMVIPFTSLAAGFFMTGKKFKSGF